jgi:hypothetical protein
MSSSQLTHIFFRGVGIPPSSLWDLIMRFWICVGNSWYFSRYTGYGLLTRIFWSVGFPGMKWMSQRMGLGLIDVVRVTLWQTNSLLLKMVIYIVTDKHLEPPKIPQL